MLLWRYRGIFYQQIFNYGGYTYKKYTHKAALGVQILHDTSGIPSAGKNVYNLFLICWQHVLGLFVFCFFRLQWTHRKHVKVQGESPDNTRSDFRLDLLRCMRVWTLLHAELRGVATPIVFWMLTAYPQAMTVCQWLLWMWWDLELQEHVQHKLLVSYNSSCVATLLTWSVIIGAGSILGLGGP